MPPDLIFFLKITLAIFVLMWFHRNSMITFIFLWKICPFHYWWLECKSRKSTDTWNNRQVWPWDIQQRQGKVSQSSVEKHVCHSKHLLPTTQEMTLHLDITRWSIQKINWLYYLQSKMEMIYIVSKNKTWSEPVVQIMRSWLQNPGLSWRK